MGGMGSIPRILRHELADFDVLCPIHLLELVARRRLHHFRSHLLPARPSLDYPPPLALEQIQARNPQQGREEIPASCNEAIASVKIALLSINRSPRARKEPFCPSRKNKKKREMQSGATRSHRREQRAREAVARTNLDRPQVHSRRAASGFWLATAVARPWRRRHAQ